MLEKDKLQIGKTYGCYTILNFLENKPKEKRYCLCKCENCGEIRKVGYYKVTHNNYEYCPKCRPKPKLKNDLTGKKFGRLEVLSRCENHIQPSGITKIKYKCICECGNVCYVSSSHLINGHTSSCGCLHKEKIKEIHNNLIGKKFGRLTVLEKMDSKLYKQTTWLCKCDCGKICTASTRTLNSGRKKSCGCLVSAAEDEFTNLLLEHNISFIKQFKLDKCKDKKSLPFDFAIFENDKLKMLVELNGQQHYAPFTYNNESNEVKILNYENRLRKDKIKKDFCEKHKIPLLIISYKDFSNMWYLYNEFIKDI